MRKYFIVCLSIITLILAGCLSYYSSNYSIPEVTSVYVCKSVDADGAPLYRAVDFSRENEVWISVEVKNCIAYETTIRVIVKKPIYNEERNIVAPIDGNQFLSFRSNITDPMIIADKTYFINDFDSYVDVQFLIPENGIISTKRVYFHIHP